MDVQTEACRFEYISQFDTIYSQTDNAVWQKQRAVLKNVFHEGKLKHHGVGTCRGDPVFTLPLQVFFQVVQVGGLGEKLEITYLSKLPWAKKFTCEKNLSVGITAGCQSCRIHQGKKYLQSFEQGWERISLNCKKIMSGVWHYLC